MAKAKILIELFLAMCNVGLFLTMAFGVLLLLRPVTNRLLAPQQRVWLWFLGWFCCLIYSPMHILGRLKVLPFTFRDLVVPRTGGGREVPAFLPPLYSGAGTYHIALPGGKAVPVETDWRFFLALFLFWLAGVVLLLWRANRQEKELARMCRRGRLLKSGDVGLSWPDKVAVWLCPDLPTSFVRSATLFDNTYASYIVCLQEELPEERQRLILRHELTHIRLKHTWMKIYLCFGIVWAWWSPVIWLAYRLTCRDMELACDQEVLSGLKEDGRREYARTLVELGSGKYLWTAPMSFGECDAEIRVRRAVNWKPWGLWARLLTWGVTALLALFFFTGGPVHLALEADLSQAWQQELSAGEIWEYGWRRPYEEEPLWREAWWRVEMEETDAHGGSAVSLYARDQEGNWWSRVWLWSDRWQDLQSSAWDEAQEPDLTGFTQMPVP